MSDIAGVWKHEMVHGTSSMSITHTLDADGQYKTEMIYPMHGGRQRIYHYGRYEANDGKLVLTFDRGETEMVDCDDASHNFAMRDFTQNEIDEAQGLLAQDIGYKLEGDDLTTILQGPMGEMSVTYKRQ